MPNQKTVLYIYDRSDWARLFRERMGDARSIVTATSPQQVLTKFYNHHLAAIIIGGGGTSHELTRLVTIIRPRYRGPMIAAHHEDTVNHELMMAGCPHLVDAKLKAAELVRRVI